MIHGDDYGAPEWILLLVCAPVVGAAIGLILGFWKPRPAISAISTAVGGTAGACLGATLYWYLKEGVIGGRDLNILTACAVGGFLCGVVVFGMAVNFVSGARRGNSTGTRLGCPGCGFVVACAFVMLVGAFLFAIASERSAFIPIDPDVKYAGIACILGGAGTLLIGLSWLRIKDATRVSS